MSSFLGARGTCGLNLDIRKSSSSSAGCSSVLTKSSSVSSVAISTKRARTPRKRLDQSYMEAATLLSTACPNVFPIKNMQKKCTLSLSPLSSHSSSSLSSVGTLPSFPVPNDVDFLIEEPSPDQSPSFPFKFMRFHPAEKSCVMLRSSSPPKSPDYDVDSIFEHEAGDVIDSIMGKLSMNDCDATATDNANQCFGSSIGLGVGGLVGLGPGLGKHGTKITQALRGAQRKDCLSPMTMVQLKDIVPKFCVLPSLEKKNNKKKKVCKGVKDGSEVINKKARAPSSTVTDPCNLEGELKSGLGLKLDHERVVKAWGDRSFPILLDPGTTESLCARLSQIDLAPETEGGIREPSLQRYLEKRRSRQFSNKIRYQVRKANADCKPRMKGRFVKNAQSHPEAMEEESK